MVGLVYGLVAISFVVIYRASKIVNFAQGEVLVVGALLLWTFTLGAAEFGFEIPFWSGLLADLGRCILFRPVLERFVFRPLIGQPAFSIFMASIALLVMLRGIAQLIWTAETRPFPQILPAGGSTIGPFLVSARLLIGGVFTLVLAFGLHAFFTRSRRGLRWRPSRRDHIWLCRSACRCARPSPLPGSSGPIVATCGAVVLLSGRIVSLDVAQIGFKALPVALLGGLEFDSRRAACRRADRCRRGLAMAYLIR